MKEKQFYLSQIIYDYSIFKYHKTHIYYSNFSIFLYDRLNFNNCKKKNKLSEHKELENISKTLYIFDWTE